MGKGLIKLVGLGMGILVVVIAVAVIATLMMREETDSTPEATVEEPTAEAEVADSLDIADTAEVTEEDLLAEFEDPTAIEKIMSNLDFLDYEPEPDELPSQDQGMSVEDSLEQMNWLEQQKVALAQKEAELNERQKKLEQLEQTVSRKLLVLEQAETARVNSLAKLYDSMEPQAVAQLMANLDDNTVVSILPRMKVKNASRVLALMPPQRAAKLSKRMLTIAEK